MIFDTHCHIYDDIFSAETDEIINKAKEKNVTKMLILGDNITNSKKAILLAEKYNQYAAAGIFPCECYNLDLNKTMIELENLIKGHKSIICIGEIGLDYYWENNIENKNIQKEFFKCQLSLADKLNLPVSIHARDSLEDVYSILKEKMPKKGAIMHCFSGSKEMMEKFLKLGCFISLGGPVTFKNARVPKEIALNVPLERLLVETDSPYLAPSPYRGQRNEPSYIVKTVEEIARIRNVDAEEIATHTYINACNLFGIQL